MGSRRGHLSPTTQQGFNKRRVKKSSWKFPMGGGGFSLLMAENPDDPKRNRMQILLDLLAKEKRAAHLRSNDTTSQKNDDAVKSNSVGTRGSVNRGGRGRGRGGMGFSMCCQVYKKSWPKWKAKTW